ncbi:hypothetical protein JG688_00014684, partial [Phytophthora aleatoria]
MKGTLHIIECDTRLLIMLSRVDGACQFGHEGCDNGVFRVEVSKSVTVHNHKIGPSVYCQYAKSRKIVR